MWLSNSSVAVSYTHLKYTSFWLACGQYQPYRPKISVLKPCASYKWQSSQSPISM